MFYFFIVIFVIAEPGGVGLTLHHPLLQQRHTLSDR